MSEKFGSTYAGQFVLTANPNLPHNGLELVPATDKHLKDPKVTKYTADNAVTVVNAAIKAALKLGMQLNRWSFYVPEISQTLPKLDKGDTQRNLIPSSKLPHIIQLLKEEVTVTCTVARFGKPRITVGTGTTTKSAKEDTRIYI